MTEIKLDKEEIAAFLDEVFPQIGGQFEIEEVRPLRARVRLKVDDGHLRPGGTVSGPAMFALADCAYYIALLAVIGREALAVTANFNINFLRRPPPEDIVAEVRILKLGRRLASGDITLYPAVGGEPVAHATTIYAIPAQT